MPGQNANRGRHLSAYHGARKAPLPGKIMHSTETGTLSTFQPASYADDLA